MFDDWDWAGTRRDEQLMRRQRWLAGVRRPVVIEIGAGTGIPTVRAFAERIVLQHGGALIRVNPREPHIGALRGVGIAGDALPTLAAIDALL
jgi:hypothetical protein